MVLTTLQRLANKLQFYSPDQARAADGEWTNSDSGSRAVKIISGVNDWQPSDRGAQNEGRALHIEAITRAADRISGEREKSEAATIAKAKAFAQKAHEGDPVKFDHSERVADTVKAWNPNDANQVAAAYLHDIPNGSETVHKEFGQDVGKLYDEVNKGSTAVSGRAQDIKIAKIADNGKGASADYLANNEAPLRQMTDGRRMLRARAIRDLYGHENGFPGENLPIQRRRAASANRS